MQYNLKTNQTKNSQPHNCCAQGRRQPENTSKENTAPCKTHQHKNNRTAAVIVAVLVLMMLTCTVCGNDTGIGNIFSGAAQAAGNMDTTLQEGDLGEPVQAMQERLIELGYLAGDATGVYDEETLAAVMLFQEQNGIVVSGTADLVTLYILYASFVLPYDSASLPAQKAAPAASVSQYRTKSQENALELAQSYLQFSEFSYEGLIDQLEYEDFSYQDAVYAADHCGADWNQQALQSAKSYLSVSAFSYTGLVDQLEYEKYTKSQATYGADHCGANWNEQAAKSAESYLDIMSFSRSGLIDQLIYEGFTYSQADYGVTQNGY